MSDDETINGAKAGRVLARLGDAEIIHSGVAIAKADQIISLYPLESDPDYRIDISIRVEDGTTPTLSSINDDFISFTLHMPWQNIPMANLDIPIAIDEEYKYWLSFTVTLSGRRDRYAVSMLYSVARKNRNV